MQLSFGLGRRIRTFFVGVVLASGFVVRARASSDVDVDDDNQFREDVIACEEAVAHAARCCHFVVQGDACRFYEFSSTDSCGCGGGSSGYDQKHVRPVVSAGEGHRIADLSCASMSEVGPAGSTECERLKIALDEDNASATHSEKKCR